MPSNVVLLPGDGIGPEVTHAAARVLVESAKSVGLDIITTEYAIGGCAIDEFKTPLPEETLEACRKSDAVLLGAVGGPKWDRGPLRPEQGLLGLRKGLGVYANLRPVKPIPSVAHRSSPLRPEYLEGVDLLVVRELTGDVYFGQPRFRRIENGEERAVDTMEYRESEVRRVAEVAFKLARGRRKKVTSVDKANVLESSRLWRDVVTSVHKNYPDVELEHQLVDSCAIRLINAAKSFDVIVTGNLFGDILTDEAGVLAGSLGVLPSASLGDTKVGLYEPIHGSAPDIAGKNLANPVGAILSAALLFRYSLDRPDLADRVERAVSAVLDDGDVTPDLGGTLTTDEVTEAILSRLLSISSAANREKLHGNQ